ncbi:hypothetical protein Hamer_G004245 [Homarus americanus]|uniref:Uncharacterized protein n=1 Tax=Homarus americanus TaxID=6706 RepID=A0A8J5MQ30_HOMAM|nr:hypothetical protein Hamer_G004245 [Homarus americanus]
MPVSLLIIWIMAVFSIAVGAFWSGKVRHKLQFHGPGSDDDDVESGWEEHSKELSTEELLELTKEENETLKP